MRRHHFPFAAIFASSTLHVCPYLCPVISAHLRLSLSNDIYPFASIYSPTTISVYHFSSISDPSTQCRLRIFMSNLHLFNSTLFGLHMHHQLCPFVSIFAQPRLPDYVDLSPATIPVPLISAQSSILLRSITAPLAVPIFVNLIHTNSTLFVSICPATSACLCLSLATVPN